jgi:hypothetical protein
MSYFYIPCLQDGQPACVYALESDGYTSLKSCHDSPNIDAPACKPDQSLETPCLLDCSQYGQTSLPSGCAWASCLDSKNKPTAIKVVPDVSNNFPSYPSLDQALKERPYDACSNYKQCQENYDYPGCCRVNRYNNLDQSWIVQKRYQL